MRTRQTIHGVLLLVLAFCSVTFAELIAYYPFEEGSGDTTADTTGNGHDGTLASGVEWIEGYSGGGVHHDTAGERIVIGPIDPSGETDAMTLAAWINWEGLNGSIAQQGIIGKRNAWAAENRMWDVEIHQTHGTLHTHLNGGQSVDMGAFPEAERAHVALTYDGSTARIYSNGALAADGAYTPGPTRAGGPGDSVDLPIHT